MPTCDYHFEHDAANQPVGERCGKRATHLILWPQTGHYSHACWYHSSPEVLKDAPPHRVRLLPN